LYFTLHILRKLFGGLPLSYDVIISRKEMMIKVTLGENPYRVFALNAIEDTAVFSLSFFGLSLVLEQFSHVRYKFGFVCLLFLSMLAVNAIVNLLITRVNLKKDFSNDISSKGTLTATYIVKFIGILLASVILSANFIIIEQSLDYFKQEDFFKGKQDYNYYKICYTSLKVVVVRRMLILPLVLLLPCV